MLVCQMQDVMFPLHRRFDCVQYWHGNTSLHVSLRVFPERGKAHFEYGQCPSVGWGSQPEQKGDSGLSTSVRLSLLPDGGHSVTGCLTLLLL